MSAVQPCPPPSLFPVFLLPSASLSCRLLHVHNMLFAVRIRPAALPRAPRCARRPRCLPDSPLRAPTKLYSLRLQSFIDALRSCRGLCGGLTTTFAASPQNVMVRLLVLIPSSFCLIIPVPYPRLSAGLANSPRLGSPLRSGARLIRCAPI